MIYLLGIIVLIYICTRIKSKKYMNINLILLFVGTLILLLSTSIGFTWTIFMNPYVLMFSGIIVCYLCVQLLPQIRNLLYKIDTYEDMQILNRDIDVEYNPSITSYLMKGTIKIKDVAADIMNLYARKIINVEKQVINDKIKYKLTVNEDEVIKNNIIYSDKYIIDTIIQKKYKFKFKQWENFVTNIFGGMGLYEKEKEQFKIKYLIYMLLIVFLISNIFFIFNGTDMRYAIIKSITISCVAGIFIIPFALAQGSKAVQKINLNKTGKEEVKKWLKFKKYIKEYTLLKDRNIEDIVLYEKYIPYAVALEVNLNYKDTIFSTFNQNEIIELIKDVLDEDVFEEYFDM